jgi:hypothetical protein
LSWPASTFRHLIEGQSTLLFHCLFKCCRDISSVEKQQLFSAWQPRRNK